MTKETGANQTCAQSARRRLKVKGLVLGVLLFSVFSNLLMLTGPLFMLQVYDRVLTSRSEETLLALFALVGALYGLLAMFEFARGRVMARVGARLQSALDPQLLRVSLARAIAPASRRKPSVELNDVETVRAFLSSPIVLAIFDAP